MAGMEERSGDVEPLTFEQIFELLESTTLNSPAGLLCRVEDLLLRGTGATSVEGFLVDRWFNKLLHCLAVTEGDADSSEEAGGAAGGVDDRSIDRSQGQRREAVFDTRVECNIGDGVVGVAAMTGRKLRVRDCRTKQGRRPQNPVYSTRHASGSLVCWPVQKRTRHVTAAGRGSTAAALAKEAHPSEQLEDVEVDADRSDEPPGAMKSAPGVLAVLQLHCAEGELSAEALEILHGVGRLLAPLLSEALARAEECVRRRSAEALLSLSRIIPRQMGLITMIDEIARVAKRLTEAEGVWFFFVDHEAHELWVAESANLGEERLNIGEGLCGHAAATGGTVNVIDSYGDSRFDRRWDERTGSVTKSALCVPIPPPEHTPRTALQKDGAVPPPIGRGTESRVPVAVGGFRSKQAGSSSSLSSLLSSSSQCHEHDRPESVAGAERPAPQGSRNRPASITSTRPLAVLKVTNKQGRGIFNEHEERALVRLCAGVESLLRSKAAEVSLLWSGMTERSLIRESNNLGGAGGAWSNHARVESTIMRLYSEASFPADAVALRRQLSKRSSAARCRALSDSTNDVHVDFAKKSGGSLDRNTYGSGGGKPAEDDGEDREHRVLTGDLELVDLSMSMFELGSEQLLSLMARFFRNMDLTDMFQISEQKMWSFLRAVDQLYQPHAFHNLVHAVSVTHVSFTIVQTTEIISLLRPLDKLALLVAAFCHDIDHPGNNNAYEVNSVSPLALQYGDSSVLERHHVFVTYQVLLQEGGANNIFSGLTRAQFRDARLTIVQAILGTDMSSHMEHCANVFQFAQKAERQSTDYGRGGVGGSLTRETSGLAGEAGEAFDEAAEPRPPAPPWRVFSVDKPEDRSFLTKTIVHCADLSGQVLDTPIALEWGRRILEEFRLQARLEANNGLPRTTVASGDMETTIKGQHFFAVKIVKPLWEPFVALFPKLKPLLDSLNENCEYYRQEGLRLERERLSTTSNPLSPQRGGREGRGNDGKTSGGNNDHDDGNNGDGGGRACGGGDDQAWAPTKEEWAGAGKAAAGDGGGHQPVSSNNGGGGG